MKKRIAALLLAMAMMLTMSVSAFAAPAAPARTVIRRDTVIHDAETVEIVEEEVKLTVKGAVAKIIAAPKAEESEIVVRKGAYVNEIQIDSEETEVTVHSGAVVETIVLNGEDAEVSGRGTVNVVYANGEEAEIDVPGTKVIVGEHAEDVEAGGTALKPGDIVIVNPNGHGVTPAEPEAPAVKLVEEAKVVDLGWSSFVAVRFAEGTSLANCTLAVDGVDVTAAFTPVTDDGSIVKWEVTSPKHAKLTVTRGTDVQTLTLGKGKGEAPAVKQGQTPDAFLLNGPVYVWDYHLTNYDDAGNIRVVPAKTTMALGAAADRVASYSPDAILHHDDTALPYFVKGEVELMFNYAAGTEAEKAFVDGITDVDLVAFNEYKNTLNDNLSYTLDKAYAHNGKTVACIKVPLGQVNFTANGRYNLRVTSNGKATLFPIHVVEEVVPSMTVTGDNGYSGKEVHLRIADMTYGITSPIYRVDLTSPAGESSTLAKFDDWFLHGDLLVLYNDKTNHFPVDGNYTVTVYADGFQTFSKTFHQTAFTGAAAAAVTVPVDAIATASVGGGSSSGGGDAGDTKVMNANLILNSDLLVNAKIVVALGLKDAAAEGIAARWDSMTKLYVFNEGAEAVYTAENYFDAVNAARVEGKYLTFADYIASGKAVTTGNRPYAVKQVLEDNLLGETTSFREAVGKKVPALTLTAQTESTAVFSCADSAYLAKLTEGELLLNTSYPALTADQYTVDTAAGTLTLNTVKVGRNTLKISVPGYQTAEIIFNINKVLEDVTLTAGDITRGEELVITCGAAHKADADCDFFANLTAVKITAPNGKTDNVYPEGTESIFDKIGYTVSGNTLTIGKDEFNESFALNEDGSFAAGVYTITLTADYYGEKTLTVNVQDVTAAEKAAPAVKEITYKTQFMGGNYYTVAFEGSEEDTAAFVAAINNISINGQKVDPVASFFNDTFSYKTSNDPAFGGKDLFVDFTEDCFKGEAKVVITADGYETLTFTVKDGNLVEIKAAAPAVKDITYKTQLMGGNYYRVSFAGEPAAYLNAITEITLDGTPVNAVTNLFGETKSYKLSNDPAYGGDNKFVDFTADCFGAGRVQVVITAKGYEDKTFTVENGQLLKAVPGYQNFAFQPDMFRGDHYRLSFSLEPVTQVDAMATATGGGGGGNGGGGIIIPPLPEPTPEMKALYAYVSSLKTYLDETRDSSITINGVPVDESPNATLNNANSFLVIADEHDVNRNAVVFNLDCFDNKKDAEIVIKVAGYEDLVLTVDGRVVPENPAPSEPEVPQASTAAPVVVRVEHKTGYSGSSYVVKLGNPENVADDQHVYNFLGKLTEVSVNGTVYQVAGGFRPKPDATHYTLNKSAGEITFSKESFGSGTGAFTVVMKAEGFDTLTFRVVDGQLAPAEPALPAAPAVAGIEPKSSFSGSYYIVAFDGTEEETGTYAVAITKITVNGTELTKKTSFFNDSMSYKLSNDPAFGGAYRFVDFTADCFTGTANVVITAEGYQDLSFTVVDGELAQ